MRGVGQPVDHWNGSVAGQIIQLPRLVGADHDRVDIARQDARGIGYGLATAELAVGSTEIDRLAAELAHGDLERHAGPRRRFLEDHRQGLAGKRPVATAVLVGKAHIEDRSQLARVELVDIQEMPRRAGRRMALPDRRQFARDASHAGHSRATLFMTSSASSMSRSPTISGGRTRSTLSPAVRVNNPFCRNFAAKSVAGTMQRMPSNRPPPRTSANSLG